MKSSNNWVRALTESSTWPARKCSSPAEVLENLTTLFCLRMALKKEKDKNIKLLSSSTSSNPMPKLLSAVALWNKRMNPIFQQSKGSRTRRVQSSIKKLAQT